MPRRFRSFLVLAVWVVAMPAAAQEPAPDAAPAEPREPAAETTPAPAQAEAPTPEQPAGKSTLGVSESTQVGAPTTGAPPAPAEEKSEQGTKGWDTFVTGYFRAPMTISMSPRPDTDDMNGAEHMQYSYGPNRLVDSNYYSFAYTRIQEQDWVELFVHAKKKHVEAAIGWMGYWMQGAGFRNNDAAWVPGIAYLTLDSDFAVGRMKPNIALTAGAWWPKFGYFEKYDTYTLGQYRQLGEQVRLKVPVNDDLTVTLVQGFGTGRDGNWNSVSPPPYQSTVGLDLLHYEHVQLTYGKLLDVGLHFNYQWTRDPNLHKQSASDRAYSLAREAKFSTFGGEATLKVPVAGRLWVSPSFTRIRNGWALSKAGIEIMHSISGEGYATNYMAFNNSMSDSTGTGSSLNFGFLYENKLSEVLGKPGEVKPEVTLNVFGLYIDANLDLPTTTTISQDRIAQMKYGADATVQVFDWMSFMLRWDEVNYDLDHPGYVFSSITPRLTFYSNVLSGESIYIQYSRYRYGENMVLAGAWPWNLPLVPGNDTIQGGPYAGQKPDMDVIKLQASVNF